MGYQPETQHIRTISSALIASYRKRWLEWGLSGRTSQRLEDNLYVIEFRAADCDTDELFEAFVKAHQSFERAAYGGGQHHFGIGYLAKRPDQDGGLIRVLVMVEQDQVIGFRIVAEELSISKSGIKVARCEIDAGDPDAHWRWLAEHILASVAQFDGEPRFVLVGAAPLASPWTGKIYQSEVPDGSLHQRRYTFPRVELTHRRHLLTDQLSGDQRDNR